jgi:hypothetical protein
LDCFLHFTFTVHYHDVVDKCLWEDETMIDALINKKGNRSRKWRDSSDENFER